MTKLLGSGDHIIALTQNEIDFIDTLIRPMDLTQKDGADE